jgi:hypothetical protein
MASARLEQTLTAFSRNQKSQLILAQAERIASRPHIHDAEAFLVDSPGPIAQLKTELDKTGVQLEGPSLKRRTGDFAKSLRWPFRNKEVEKSIQIMERHKSTLSANLGLRIL